jgi:hypothetical protein
MIGYFLAGAGVFFFGVFTGAIITIASRKDNQ